MRRVGGPAQDKGVQQAGPHRCPATKAESAQHLGDSGVGTAREEPFVTKRALEDGSGETKDSRAGEMGTREESPTYFYKLNVTCFHCYWKYCCSKLIVSLISLQN